MQINRVLGLLLLMTMVACPPAYRGGGGDDDDAIDDDDATDDDDDCPAGEIEDCNGHCAPENWLSDGECDDGQWAHDGNDIVLNCSDLDWDGGDCETDDDDPCFPTAAQLACEAPGEPLGAGAWEAEAWGVPLTNCGDDVWVGPMMTFDVGSGRDSMFFGFSAAGSQVTLSRVVTEGGETLVDVSVPYNRFGGDTWTYLTDPSFPTAVLPQTPQTPMPSSGCFAVLPVVTGATSDEGILYTTVSDGPEDGRIFLDVVIVEGAGVDSSDLEPALYAAADLLYYGSGEGTDLYEGWAFYTVSDSSYANIPSDGPQMNAMRSIAAGSNPRSVKLFIIDTFDEGLLGIAGGIPGPLGQQGLATSAIVVAAGPHGGDAEYMAGTIVHELGHYVGLFHTTESKGGAWDPLGDTPECPGTEITPANCSDGTNLMFWSHSPDGEETVISGEQADVFNNSPIRR